MSSNKNVHIALESVKNGTLSIGKASRTFMIPETTLREYAQRDGIAVKAASRGYVRTKDNVALHEAVDLVVQKGVAVNTAAMAKNVPRTTLRKALETKIIKASVKTVAPKKAKYAPITQESSSSVSVAYEASVDNTNTEIPSKPTMIKTIIKYSGGTATTLNKVVEVHGRAAYNRKMYDAPKEQTNDEPYWSPSAEEFSGHSSDDDVQPAANTHLHFRDFSMSPTPATCDPQNPPTPFPTTPTVNRSQIYTPTPPGSPNLFEFCDDGEPLEIEEYKPTPRKDGCKLQHSTSPVVVGSKTIKLRRLAGSKDAMIAGNESSLSSVVNPASPLHWSSSDEEDRVEGRGRRRRLNVTEKFLNVVSKRLTKYCPICPYKTDDNKLTRHIGIKHFGLLRRPAAASLKAIGKILGSESRRSVSLIPMSTVKAKLGPYWDDVAFRRVAFQLCLMGRVKTYGEQWDLPEAPITENPFEKYLELHIDY